MLQDVAGNVLEFVLTYVDIVDRCYMLRHGICVELHTCDMLRYGICVELHTCDMLRNGTCVDLETCYMVTCFILGFVLNYTHVTS